MATDAPYTLSRAAMRRRFGQRAIDASAPQSTRDTTPSGVAAIQKQRGVGDIAQAADTAAGWQRLFPNSQWADSAMKDMRAGPPAPGEQKPQQAARPFDIMRRRQAAQTPLEAIRLARESGATSGSFATPYGQVGFADTPKLMPEQPVADVSDYIGSIGGSRTEQLFPSLRKPRRASILDGAQRWMNTV